MVENIVLDASGFHHMMDWGFMNGWGFLFLGLFFIGIFIVIILVVVYLIIHSEKTEEKEHLYQRNTC